MDFSFRYSPIFTYQMFWESKSVMQDKTSNYSKQASFIVAVMLLMTMENESLLKNMPMKTMYIWKL